MVCATAAVCLFVVSGRIPTRARAKARAAAPSPLARRLRQRHKTRNDWLVDPRKEGARENKKGRKRVVPAGVAHIQASFNNTTVTIADMEGNVVAGRAPAPSASRAPGRGHLCGELSKRRLRPRTALVKSVCGCSKCSVKGPGSGRDSAIRALQTAGMEVRAIRDVTPIPHNGCRPPKRRRV